MSGEGVIAARAEGLPDAVDRPIMTVPHVVGHLAVAGEWCVMLLVPNVAGEPHRWALLPDQADKLADELREYAQLIREKAAA